MSIFSESIPTSGTSSGSGGFFNSPLFSGILSSLGGVATGILGNMAANTQANAATTASQQAQDTLLKIYNQQRSDAAPYTLAGYGAVNRLSDLLGLNPQRYAPGGTTTASPLPNNVPLTSGRATTASRNLNRNYSSDGFDSYGALQPMGNVGGIDPMAEFGNFDNSGQVSSTATMGGSLPSDFGSLNHDFSLADFSADPGYAFRQSEGQKALERSAAARGSVLGGGTLKALSRYGQDFASNEYTNAFNRYQVNRTNKINPLLSLSNMGQVSAGQVSQAGSNTANGVASSIYTGATDAANARASGYASTANGINSGINSINNLSLLRNLGRI